MSANVHRIYLKHSMQTENTTPDGQNEQFHTSIIIDKVAERLKKKYNNIIEFIVARDGAMEDEVTDAVMEYDPDLIIDTHLNAYDGKAEGTEVYCNTQGIAFATDLYEEVGKVSPGIDRSIHTTNDFYILRIRNYYGEPIASALVELCFYDNVTEFNHLITHYDDYARAIEKAIVRSFNVDYVEDEEMQKIVVVPYGIADMGAAEILAMNYHLACIPASDITENESYVQVGGAEQVRKDRQCITIISGVSREDTADKVCKIVRERSLKLV